MELYVSSKMVSVVWMYQVAKKEGFFLDIWAFLFPEKEKLDIKLFLKN